MDYRAALSVFLGAGFGGLLRFYLSAVAARYWPDFPVGTLVANLVGCFLMGCLLGLLSREQNESLRLFVGVGVLGGFTTFSAFSSDSLRMIQRGEFGLALGYLALSLGGSLLFCWLGYALFANQG